MFNRKRRSDGLGKSVKWKELEELVLPNAKLRFCSEQLQNLNFIFNKRLHQNISIATGSKLTQHFLYDSDSRPKYSVIETDSDYPAAYARIRLHTSSFKTWGDYTNSSGYLRRDKVQARLVELLALVASKDIPNSPLHVDESVLCGIPGKVVDSVTLHDILKIPPHQHIYYGPGGNVPRFPDPRDFRLAIVDEPSGIRLRVDFLSPALSNISLDVRILVAIGIDTWPSSTNFPSRISLGHSDCLLYHHAAQTGMYLVGYGVQSSAWQIRVPAAEYVILNHYGPNSTVKTVLDILFNILEDIDRSRTIGKQQELRDLPKKLGNEEFNKAILAQESEMALLHKWKDLLDGLLPPSGTRGRRFCFAGSKNKQEVAHTQYTLRQLDYIGLLLNKMLDVKQHILQDSITSEANEHENPLEDVIFILVTIMDQARDQYLSSQTNPTIIKNKLKIKSNYNTYTSKLVELMRRDKDLLNFNFEDDLVLVKIILKWMYKAMDQNKRYLAPILRPYLNNIFATSHAISWHIDTVKKRAGNDELAALGSFAELVNSGKITPAQGLIDSVNKNWNWAKSMLNMVEKNTLRVVFVSDRGKVYRHILSLPSYQRKGIQSGSKTLESPIEKNEVRRQKTLPNRSYFNTILKERANEFDADITPQHDSLKNASPLNFILSNRHRRGEHRGEGDIFDALKAMQKLSVKVASNLPQEDRLELSELIQNIQAVKSKKAHAKKWSGTLPQLNHRGRVSPKCETLQKYTPKEESAGIRIRDINEDLKFKLKK
ncbi:hypothetical protein NQ314_018153 [Rhamnusium bicolor]|uniref:Uncharacterized protein n=1 Tax=Rhamnusium bicolor TaxID=1586634 RepID=A0AAV8WSF8_9CUCU|nr:hypothetical protein NQ314_018153 [Rhamnusium bicolor]